MENNELSFRLAVPGDLEALMELYRSCTLVMNRMGFFNWHEGYPDQETVKKDIKDRSLHLCPGEGRLLGAVTLNEDEPPEYSGLSWIPVKGKIMVVHRLAVSPDFQRRGIAGRIMEYAEQTTQQLQVHSIHMDVYSINVPARNLYRKLGYRELEDFYFPGFEIPFTGLEKCLISGSQK
ncbi:MAG: GNAT family N-acetyltransferase [Bacteroidota bacterium]